MPVLSIASPARLRHGRKPLLLEVSDIAAAHLVKVVGSQGRCDHSMLSKLMRIRLVAEDDHQLTRLITELMREGTLQIEFVDRVKVDPMPGRSRTPGRPERGAVRHLGHVVSSTVAPFGETAGTGCASDGVSEHASLRSARAPA